MDGGKNGANELRRDPEGERSMFMPLKLAEFLDARDKRLRARRVPKPNFWFYLDEPYEFYGRKSKFKSSDPEWIRDEDNYYRDLWGYSAFNRPWTWIYWCCGSSCQDPMPDWCKRLMR